MLLNTTALYLLLVSAMGLPVFLKRQPGTLESTITTTIDGKAVTMLEKVYTSTDRPAQTSVVMTTLKTSYEVPISATETSDTSTVSSTFSTTSSTGSSTGSSAASDNDSSASTEDLVLSANVEKTTSSSATSSSSSSSTTPSSSSPISVASSTVSVSSDTATPSVTTMPSASFTSFTPYATETTDGTCYVFYENGDAYDSFSPTTTQTLTVTVATVTLSTTV
ncbi:hypothetical protein KL935_004213 [Ogataea polymorpha]|nr:hypothetical protein KL937_004001 [Ogataea polymorpha]KAG7890224.1 hypothetical protein KL908_004562 [Ogataea polymorpha]KAG7898614.1 hypothetical protein KL935_004213 [Ogataea polymorpha]KAG7931148.1 hypothetical protein KL934_004269 [Ogataea polymorpha]KAG7933127.1 hypothetical protein KL904_004183 [Ogataea polymorpha]